MNAMTRLGDNSLTQDDIRAIMDHRGKTNWIKGAHGYFAGSYPQGGGGGGKMGLTNLTESDIIKKGKECFIHDDKINKFFLLPGTKHSIDFFDVGYTTFDGDKLKKDIADNFSYDKAVEKKMINGSERFNIYMNLGITKIKRFRTVWQKDEPDSIPRIITAYRKD